MARSLIRAPTVKKSTHKLPTVGNLPTLEKAAPVVPKVSQAANAPGITKGGGFGGLPAPSETMLTQPGTRTGFGALPSGKIPKPGGSLMPLPEMTGQVVPQTTTAAQTTPAVQPSGANVSIMTAFSDPATNGMVPGSGAALDAAARLGLLTYDQATGTITGGSPEIMELFSNPNLTATERTARLQQYSAAAQNIATYAQQFPGVADIPLDQVATAMAYVEDLGPALEAFGTDIFMMTDSDWRSFMSAWGQTVTQTMPDGSTQEVRAPWAEMQARDILNTVRTNYLRNAGRYGAQDILQGTVQGLSDLQTSSLAPEQAAWLWDMASGQHQAITDEAVNRRIQEIDRLIMRTFGEQATARGQEAAARGMGAASLGQQLSQQARTRALEAQIGARNELYAWQEETNARMQSEYARLFLLTKDADQARQIQVQGMISGLRQQMAALEAGQTYNGYDYGTMYALTDAFEQFSSDEWRYENERNGIGPLLNDIIWSIIGVFLPAEVMNYVR